MASPIPPSRSALPPVAQLLAAAALQRQTALLGAEPKPGIGASPRSAADPGAPPASTTPPAPLPVSADRASISPQARQALAFSFTDPRRSGLTDSRSPGIPSSNGQPRAVVRGFSGGAEGSAALAGAAMAAPVARAAWPAAGLGAPLIRMVQALVAQVTAEAGAPQRVAAAQSWPLGLAQALEGGTLDADQPPLQTWLVRQGLVQTADGARGLALTLRAPVPWLASHAAAGVGAGAGVSAGPANATAAGALQVPFTGGTSALQSGVIALVLQGMDGGAPRTSALLVLDMQPQLAAAVYGRETLFQQQAGRLDPWTQMAILQASGQVPREDERGRSGRDGDPLCETAGCPYLARAACVQPFCLALRNVPPVQEATPPAAS